MEAVRQAFRPEFLGRLDSIVRFGELSDAAMETIAWKYLRQLQTRVQALGTQLQLPQEIGAQLGCRCRGKDGARHLRRLVQTEVEGPLSSYLLRCSRRPARVKLKTDGNTISFC